MDWNNFFVTLPTFGWIAIFLMIFITGALFFGIYQLLKTKDLRINNFEILQREKLVKNEKEMQQSIGKNLLDNQSANAHNLLEKIWIDIYERGKLAFNIIDKKDLWLLQDIAHLIEDKLNYEVKNDLTRNHITEKNDDELSEYSSAKAAGYYRATQALLYKYNEQLPDIYLPDLMDRISLTEYELLFHDIYFSARKIAGGN